MKKSILIFLLVVSQAYCQNPAENNRFELNSVWKFNALYPIPFGDNSLAKAYDNDLGFGLSLGLFRYNEFRFELGWDIVQYRVTDQTRIGIINNSNYNSFYGAVSYEIPVMEKITITPNLGYGSAELSMRSSSKSFGSQDGNEYRIGVVGSFYFSEYSAVTFGVRYIHTKLDINTHPDYEKFYGQMNQVQFAVGFAFD